MPDLHLSMRPTPDEWVCDFCSDTPVKWSYPARPHVMGEVARADLKFGMGSSDAWAACDPCHDIIERSDREALAQRSAERFASIHGGSVALHLSILRSVHDRFWSNREGAPEPVETPS